MGIMEICAECKASERQIWPIYTAGLCCRARSVANTPRVLMSAAYDAAITGLDEAQAAWVRNRCYEILGVKGRAA
jgi:hypothetical protein